MPGLNNSGGYSFDGALNIISGLLDMGIDMAKIANPKDNTANGINDLNKVGSTVNGTDYNTMQQDYAAKKNFLTGFNTDKYLTGLRSSEEGLSTLQGFGKALGKGAGTGSGMAAGILGTAGLLGYGIASAISANKRRNQQRSLLGHISDLSNNLDFAYNAKNESLFNTDLNNKAANIRAYGGPLGVSLSPVGGAIDYMQNEDLLNSLSLGDSYTNNKKTSVPIFAYGGNISGYGADFTNGLTFINEGGTHEENPMGGVLMGISEDGEPNFVEEGEVIWNNYVFSNRLKVPENIRKVYKLKSAEDLTFADAVKQLQKSSSERPNDPIEKATLDGMLGVLAQEQEQIRQKKEMKDIRREQKKQLEAENYLAEMFADGGDIHIAKNKKGTFTAAATKHGIGVQEFASHVLANKDKYSPTMVKKANFAKNASKWNHAYGGLLGKYFDGNGEYPNYIFAGDPDFIGPRQFEWAIPEEDIIGPASLYNLTTGDKSPYNAIINPDGTKTYINPTTQLPTQLSTQQNTVDKKDNMLPTTGPDKYLRYASPLINAGLFAYHALRRPDYSYADAVRKAGDRVRLDKLSPRELGDYLAYRPFDRLFYANELAAKDRADARALMNLGNGNRAATAAHLLAHSYNMAKALGEVWRKGEEYNDAQRARVAEFNRGTNQYNADADFKAQMANSNNERFEKQIAYESAVRDALMRQAIDNQKGQDMSVALNNLAEGLSGIGQEAQQRYWINGVANTGAFGRVPDVMLDAYIDELQKEKKRRSGKSETEAYGGKLNRNKKKGITI